jgi:hypothetical protein
MSHGLRRIVMYKDETHAPVGLTVGERVIVVRGDGPREGDVMAHATITETNPGLTFEITEWDPGRAAA